MILSSLAIIYNVLKVDAPLLVSVPLTSIYMGVIPLNVSLPAIALTEISTVENTTIDANATFALVTGRVQITVAAKDYVSVKNIIKLVRKACNYKNGTIAGFIVSVIMREYVGADFRDDDANIFYQTIDFRIVYHEQN